MYYNDTREVLNIRSDKIGEVITRLEQEGWEFVSGAHEAKTNGVRYCRLKFTRTVYKTFINEDDDGLKKLFG